MGCTKALLGIGRGCKANLAGIDTIYIADFDLVTPTVDKDTMLLTNLVSKGEDTKPFKTYLLDEEVGSLTSTLTKATGGIHYYTHEINVQFTEMDADKHLEMQAISKGQLAVVVKDNNQRYWYCGADKYLSGNDTVAQAGQSFDDLNGYTSVIRGRSATMPFEIRESVLTTFLGMVKDAPTVD